MYLLSRAKTENNGELNHFTNVCCKTEQLRIRVRLNNAVEATTANCFTQLVQLSEF